MEEDNELDEERGREREKKRKCHILSMFGKCFGGKRQLSRSMKGEN